MFTTSFLICLIGQLASIQISIAVPLRVLGPQDGSRTQVDHVKTATEDAHNLILNVENVLKGPNAHAHLQNAFGPNYDAKTISNNIQTLKNGRIKVDNAQNDNYHGMGYYDPNTDRVGFGTAFHSPQRPHVRAGAVIHEASHALLGTKDNWQQQPGGSFRPVNGQFQPGLASGYADSHMSTLKATSSHLMHYNADSYRVLAHTCTYGFNVPLTRRALIEQDPVKRRALFRRAKDACPMPTAEQRAKMAAAKKAQATTDSKAAKAPATSKGKQAVVPKDKKASVVSKGKITSLKVKGKKFTVASAAKKVAARPVASKKTAVRLATARKAAKKVAARPTAARKPANRPVAAARKPAALPAPVAKKPVAAPKVVKKTK